MGKAGDTYGQRALSPDYIVVEGTGVPINSSKYEIRTGTDASAMGQPGGGTQWVVYTTRNGKLEEVSPDELRRLGHIRIISVNDEMKP